MLRYLILYANGGVYSDIDTKALKPISTWIPEQLKNKVNAVSNSLDSS
jgi:mannosyltransferase OCH1-like enzyme